MRYLLDTNIVSDLVRNPQGKVAQHIRKVGDNRPCPATLRTTSKSDLIFQEVSNMTSPSIRKHAGTGAASDQPPAPEPTFAERARTLMYLGRVGSLSTMSRKQPGFPFGSVMPYGLDEHGHPIFLISTMAMHTQNLQADARASLLVTQEDTDGEPLGASRVTLVGNVLPVPNTELTEVRKLYLERHANSKYWVDFEDFSFLWTWWIFITWAVSA